MLACSLAHLYGSSLPPSLLSLFFFPPFPPFPLKYPLIPFTGAFLNPKRKPALLQQPSPPPQSVWDSDWLDLMQVFYMSHRLCEFMFTMVLSWLANIVSLQIKLLQSFLLPLTCTLAGKRCDIDVAYRAEHSTVSYPLYINWLRVSVLIAIYCKEKMAL